MSFEQLYRNKHPWLLHVKTTCLPEYKKIKQNQLKQIKQNQLKQINPKHTTVNSTTRNYNNLINLGFQEKIIKTVLAKMKRSTKHTADHYSRTTGKLLKQYKRQRK